MYQNFKVANVKESDQIEIEGEVLLMEAYDYAPKAISAVAKLKKMAGKFMCHFEICSENEFFVAEADSFDAAACLRTVGRKMRNAVYRHMLTHPRKPQPVHV